MGAFDTPSVALSLQAEAQRSLTQLVALSGSTLARMLVALSDYGRLVSLADLDASAALDRMLTKC